MKNHFYLLLLVLLCLGFLKTPYAESYVPSSSKASSNHFKKISDLPIKNNWRVRFWIRYFQGRGKKFFQKSLVKSHRYLPKWKKIFHKKNLPQDLAYVALLESGFSAHAVSHAQAVGYWQFIKGTGKKYGLRKTWWLDERKDYLKSTEAASKYLKDLHNMFQSWELALAAYNMGENRLSRLIQKHKTNDFWKLSNKSDFPQETRNYVPKIMASILIAKLPTLYGFKNSNRLSPLSYQTIWVPGGTKLASLSEKLGTQLKVLKKLNPSLVRSLVPRWQKKGHWLRVPKK